MKKHLLSATILLSLVIPAASALARDGRDDGGKNLFEEVHNRVVEMLDLGDSGQNSDLEDENEDRNEVEDQENEATDTQEVSGRSGRRESEDRAEHMFIPSASSTLRRMKIEEHVEAMKASSTLHRVTVQREIAQRFAEHASAVLTATVERLSKIADRLESRINKVKENGGDTTLSEEALAEARAHLAQARADIAEYSSVELTADKLSENVEILRGIAEQVKSDLKEAHASLSLSVRSLVLGQSNATSTATTTEE